MGEGEEEGGGTDEGGGTEVKRGERQAVGGGVMKGEPGGRDRVKGRWNIIFERIGGRRAKGGGGGTTHW